MIVDTVTVQPVVVRVLAFTCAVIFPAVVADPVIDGTTVYVVVAIGVSQVRATSVAPIARAGSDFVAYRSFAVEGGFACR